MQIKDFLNSVCEQIKYKQIRESISEELKSHIEETKENYINEGLKEELAESKAIEQMGDSEEIGKRLNKIHRPRFDWKLVLIAVILLCFGFLISFIRTTSLLASETRMNYMIKYMTALIIGLVLSIGIYFFDYKKIFKYSKYLYLLATICIIWTLFYGSMIHGVPYLRIGTTAVSPSVIAMPLYIIAFVGFLMNEEKENKVQTLIFNIGINLDFNLCKIILLSIISLVLLANIPSMISVFILGTIYLILSTVKILKTEEKRKTKIAILWGIPIILVMLFLFIHIGETYRLDRFTAVINPESDPAGSGWLAINRKLIINSAQSFGEAEDMSNALNLFDEGTNFAFISILAHYGWILAIAMVIAVILLSIKLILNSIKIKDVYGKMIIIEISSMFIMQSLFNILMNLNLGIEANFNIPFVSYGRMELIINMVSLALILSIYRKKDIVNVKMLSNTVSSN